MNLDEPLPECPVLRSLQGALFVGIICFPFLPFILSKGKLDKVLISDCKFVTYPCFIWGVPLILVAYLRVISGVRTASISDIARCRTYRYCFFKVGSYGSCDNRCRVFNLTFSFTLRLLAFFNFLIRFTLNILILNGSRWFTCINLLIEYSLLNFILFILHKRRHFILLVIHFIKRFILLRRLHNLILVIYLSTWGLDLITLLNVLLAVNWIRLSQGTRGVIEISIFILLI